MKTFTYIRYFFYVGLNWGWRVAFIIILQEVKGEKKYGIDTTGADELKSLQKQGIDTSHATMYMPVSYPLIENALEQIPLHYRNHFTDIGCGKGRALCIAAHYGFKKLSGIDFSPAFCEAARINLLRTSQKIKNLPYEITEGDAAFYNVAPDTDCIFLFNPFDAVIMQKVASRLNASLQSHPRVVHIIYSNPLYKQLFINIGFREIYHQQHHQQFEISVMKNGA